MQWLTKQTAKTHTLREIVKQFNCTEQGAKNALTRRGMTECKASALKTTTLTCEMSPSWLLFCILLCFFSV